MHLDKLALIKLSELRALLKLVSSASSHTVEKVVPPVWEMKSWGPWEGAHIGAFKRMLEKCKMEYISLEVWSHTDLFWCTENKRKIWKVGQRASKYTCYSLKSVCWHTHTARSAPPWPPEASRWSHCTGWSGSGTSLSYPWTHSRSAARRPSSPSACCRPAWAPPCPLGTTGWWAWASLKQGTPAPQCHPRGPPGGTCPGGPSSLGELRKRKTEEGLIWGSRKSAGVVKTCGRFGESQRVAYERWVDELSSSNENEADCQ